MSSIKIKDLESQTSLIEDISDSEASVINGGTGKTEIVSCNVDGTYTYTNGSQTWKAKPWWMSRILWH